MTSLVRALAEAAERYPQWPAIQGEGRALTYAALDEFSARAAGGLLAHGLAAGDRVGLRMPHTMAFTVLYFGALRAGAVVVPLHPLTRPLTERAPEDDCGARVVFASPEESTDAGAPAGTGTGDGTLVPVGPDFLEQVAFWPQHPGVADRADNDPAVMVHSPGPAGRAGAAVLSHRALRDTARAARTLIGATAVNAPQGCVPAVSCAGRTYGLHAVILAGACLPLGGRRAAGSSSERTVIRQPSW